jgi:hypothetical protein
MRAIDCFGFRLIKPKHLTSHRIFYPRAPCFSQEISEHAIPRLNTSILFAAAIHTFQAFLAEKKGVCISGDMQTQRRL